MLEAVWTSPTPEDWINAEIEKQRRSLADAKNRRDILNTEIELMASAILQLELIQADMKNKKEKEEEEEKKHA